MSGYFACADCSVLTFPQTASAADKARYRAEGRKRAAGRGLCVNCYVRLRKQNRLGEFGKTQAVAHGELDDQAHACDRCGISHRVPGALCQDCLAVVDELGEREVWAS